MPSGVESRPEIRLIAASMLVVHLALRVRTLEWDLESRLLDGLQLPKDIVQYLS